MKIIVDHCALCALAKEKPLQGRLARWAIFLSSFDLEIEYRSGKDHLDVDCLSRQPVASEDDKLDDNEFIYRMFAIIPLEDYTSQYEEDEDCKKALESIERGDSIYKLTNEHIYKDDKLLVPASFRENIIDKTHAQGHGGIDQTIDSFQRKYYWPSMTDEIRQKVIKCKVCQAHKVPREMPAGKMNSFSPSKPFEMLCLDHIGPLEITKKGNKHVLVAVDAFSKLTMAVPTKSTGSEEVVRFVIDNIVAVHGVPEVLFSDNASGFKCKLMSEVADSFGIQLENSTPKHHTGNAIVERAIQTLKDKVAMAVQTLKDKIAKSKNDKGESDWDDQVGMACLAMNATKHTTTKYSPYETVYARRLRLPGDPREMNEQTDIYTEAIQAQLELIRRNVCESISRRAEASKKIYDAKHQEKKYNINDQVWVYFEPKTDINCNKFSPRYRGPYSVVQIRPNDIYKLKLVSSKKNKTIMAHVSRLKPYFREDIDSINQNVEMLDLDDITDDEAPAVTTERVEPTTSSRRKQTIVPKSFSMFTSMLLLMACIGLAHSFTPTEKIVWTESPIKAITGLITYEVEWNVEHPCTALFKNITNDTDLNDRMFEHCTDQFHERINSHL